MHLVSENETPQLSYAKEDDPTWKRWLIRSLEQWGGQARLQTKYEALKKDPPPHEQLFQRLLIELEIGLKVDAPAISRIPQQGPLILVANHPFGIADGVALTYLASLMRRKYSILANALLCRDELIQPFVLPIDFESTKDALKRNIESKNEALKRLQQNEAIVVFPGGGVSTAQGIRGKVTDLPWKRFVIKMIVQTGATVVPVFFEGQNSSLFQWVSQFSLNARLGLFIHECNRLRGKNLNIHIGNPIPAEEIIIKKDRQAALDWLRAQVYNLQPTQSPEG